MRVHFYAVSHGAVTLMRAVNHGAVTLMRATKIEPLARSTIMRRYAGRCDKNQTVDAVNHGATKLEPLARSTAARKKGEPLARSTAVRQKSNR